MTHPHGLTRQDVAHLKAGDEVTVRMMIDDEVRTLTSTAYDYADTLWIAGHDLKHHDGAPGAFLVEVISPKPPTPPMAEPTWLKAVVMSDEGTHVRAYDPDGNLRWTWGEGFMLWPELRNPRPLTPAEQRDLGIPETVPEGWVAVDASEVLDSDLRVWTHCHEPSSAAIRMAAAVARAELARREATA